MEDQKRLIPRLLGWGQNKALNKALAADNSTGSKKRRLTEEIARRPFDRIKLEMGTLKNAIDSAKNTYSPIRHDLYLLYDEAITDSEVRSQSRTAASKLVGEPFSITVNGVDNPALADYFHRPWFEKVLKQVFWSEMYGYTLMEFDRIQPGGEFKDCNTFPRIHVRPERKEILIDPFTLTGIPIGDIMKPLGLIEIGDPSDLGVMETITREVIWKNFSRSDWATYSEKFGNPLITLNTDADGADLDKRIAMLRNFASSGWAIGDKDSDTFDLKEPASRSGAHMLFMENIKMADQNIGKLINGQTGTANNEAWAGTAGVHERIMNDYHDSRLRTATNLINYELIPFLIYWGYPLQGASFRFQALDNSGDIKPNADQLPDAGKTIEKTDPQAQLNPPVKKKRPVAASAIDRMLESYLRRVYDGQDGIDPTIWRHNFDSLTRAILDAGMDFKTKSPLFSLANDLRTNAGTFAAFKNHKERLDLLDLLIDNKGVLRPFSEFKKVAMPVTQQYNINWLQTEYTNAVASAQMAKKWSDFEENKGDFPNLEYRAVMDSQTRPAHGRLDGLILPIDDPRWNKIYPPNGHNCRCSVTQTSKPVKDLPVAKEYVPEPGFDHNPGKDRKLFSKTNSYQVDYSAKEQVAIEKEAEKLMKDA